MPSDLLIARRAARTAGKLALSFFRKEMVAEQKADKSYFTQADIACERKVKGIISKAFPDDCFVGEEEGAVGNTARCWYIDPIDGTSAYMRGIPFFGVSVALAEGNEFVLGAIYIPYVDEMYYAQKGKGAWCNGKKIHVSDREVKDAALLTSSPARGQKIVDIHRLFKDTVHDVWCIGCSVLAAAYVAAGRCDMYITPSTSSWDFGAGVVLVSEAGGVATSIDGQPFMPKSKRHSVVLSNGKYHDSVINVLKKGGIQ